MSIQRYTYVGNDNDDIETNFNGEFVKHSDHFKRIEQLEKQVEFEYNLKVQARTQRDDLSKHIEELENQLNNK